MRVKRIVANLAAADVSKAKQFYAEILGLEVVMDQGWIVTFAAPSKMAPQISIASEGGSSTAVPDLSVEVDGRVLIYAFFFSLFAGFICGFAPGWTASRPLMPNALKGEEALVRPGRRFSLRSALVVAQITLSLILLCAAGLFLRSLQSAAKIDAGFRSRGVVMMA